MKKIGVLTSSRVSAGMNTILYYLLKSCYNNNIEVYGIVEGFNGLNKNEIIKLNYQDNLDLLTRGGTILRTGDPRELMDHDYIHNMINNYYKNEFDTLIVIGGHGSYNITRKLIDKGVNAIIIPCTLDNDYSVGYNSALDSLVNMLDKLNDTSFSHEKCTIIKIEGCSNNKLIKDVCHSVDALYVDNSSIKNPDSLLKKLHICHNTSSNALICLSANYDKGDSLKDFIESNSNFEVRYNNIESVYRGGIPCALDRIKAREFAYKAIDLYNHQQTNQYLKTKNNKVISVDIV